MLARSCCHGNESTYTSGRRIFGISQVFGDDEFLYIYHYLDGGLLALPWGSVGALLSMKSAMAVLQVDRRYCPLSGVDDKGCLEHPLSVLAV